MNQQTTHHDHFGNPLIIGDIVLTASAKRYGDSGFYYCLVVGKTKKMIRIIRGCPLNTTDAQEKVLHALYRTSKSYLGSRLEPWNCVRVTHSGLTEEDVEGTKKEHKKQINAGGTDDHVDSEEFWDDPVATVPPLPGASTMSSLLMSPGPVASITPGSLTHLASLPIFNP